MPRARRTSPSASSWFVRRGVPHFIEHYDARQDIWTRSPAPAAGALRAAGPLRPRPRRRRRLQRPGAGPGGRRCCWRRGRSPTSCAGDRPSPGPTEVGPWELVVFVVGPEIPVLLFGQWADAAKAMVIGVATLLVVYFATSYAVVPILRWAGTRAVGDGRLARLRPQPGPAPPARHHHLPVPGRRGVGGDGRRSTACRTGSPSGCSSSWAAASSSAACRATWPRPARSTRGARSATSSPARPPSGSTSPTRAVRRRPTSPARSTSTSRSSASCARTLQVAGRGARGRRLPHDLRHAGDAGRHHRRLGRRGAERAGVVEPRRPLHGASPSSCCASPASSPPSPRSRSPSTSSPIPPTGRSSAPTWPARSARPSRCGPPTATTWSRR